MPSPVDGCTQPSRNPRSPVLLQNRLGSEYYSQSRGSGDPCQPSPCGPGTTCTPNRDGNPECRCVAGFTPNPDTITGCKPECTVDPDCRMGFLCRSHRCARKPDPCDPNPCGPGAQCSVNNAGNALCQCQPGLIPNPDTITGCKPECVRDPDCQSGYVCQSQRCVFKPDPCDPSPCGPNTECSVTPNGNPICRCLPNYIPNPDTITGCKEKPDPCNPSPCGTNAECIPNGDNANCKCPPGHQGDPFVFCKKGECEYDHDCSSQLACFDFKCRDPCIGTCGQLAECQVRDHRPICSCPQGYTGDPLTACKRRTVVGAKQSRPKSEPRSVIVIGQQYSADGSSREVQQTISRGGGGRSFNRGSSRSVAVIGAGARKRRFSKPFLGEAVDA